jgi:hypothetical protein
MRPQQGRRVGNDPVSSSRAPMHELEFLRLSKAFPAVHSHCLLQTSQGEELLVASELKVTLISSPRSAFAHGLLGATQISFDGLPVDPGESRIFITSITEVPPDEEGRSPTIAIGIAPSELGDSQETLMGSIHFYGETLDHPATAEEMAEHGEQVDLSLMPGLLKVLTVDVGNGGELRQLLLVFGCDEKVVSGQSAGEIEATCILSGAGQIFSTA